MSDAFFPASLPAASRSRVPLRFEQPAICDTAGPIVFKDGAFTTGGTSELPRAAQEILSKHHTFAAKMRQLALLMEGVPQCEAHSGMLEAMGELNDRIIASYLEDRCMAGDVTATACNEIDRFANAALSAILVNLEMLTNAVRELFAPQDVASDLA